MGPTRSEERKAARAAGQEAPSGGDLLPRGPLAEVDPEVRELLDFETERQLRKIIMIASESICPAPVREAIVSDLMNIYAEGYPSTRMRRWERARLKEWGRHLSFFRRYSDRRYYKGTEYANFVESLAIRRLAELFATDEIPADDIFANVQCLSGAAANNAVYDAFVPPGGTVMGLSLAHGGHLTHGSPYNRSGKHFRIASYKVDPETGQIDFDALLAKARKVQPRMIIAGFSAQPWDIEWDRFRAVCDEVGALLFADIAHIAGLVAGKVCRNPLPYADVISFTTHKTLCGPRGAVVITKDPEHARRVDVAVFPGEQGGPHMNSVAAKAVAFEIAATEEFRALQRRIAENAKALAAAFVERRYSLAYGGTDTHLLLLDLSKKQTKGGLGLNAEIAARMLDIAGITCNKNSIARDRSATNPSGLRFGTTWVSQRGMGPAEMERIAELVDRVLSESHSFEIVAGRGALGRARVPFRVLREVAAEVEALQLRFVQDPFEPRLGYPHFTYREPAEAPGAARPAEGPAEIEVSGERAEAFLQGILTCDISGLEVGDDRRAFVLDDEMRRLAEVTVRREQGDPDGTERYILEIHEGSAEVTTMWLRAHSDGYVLFEPGDLHAKVEGPVLVRSVRRGAADGADGAEPPSAEALHAKAPEAFDLSKRFFVGQSRLLEAKKETARKKTFTWQETEGELRKTPLHAHHLQRTKARNMVPFAGWEMPVQYTSILEEHEAVRTAAGLFDVAHMGVIEVAGTGSTTFLNTVTTNFLTPLRVGVCQYNYVLDPEGHVMDDIVSYRLEPERYMVVVNASNQEKILAWFRAVISGEYVIDPRYPVRQLERKVRVRDMKDPSTGDETRVDLAFQGPRSLDVLMRIADGSADRTCLHCLHRSQFGHVSLAGVDALVSKSGYTGEPVGYELYVPVEGAAKVWEAILEAGEADGVRPTGLGARDSTRTQAGFPLYGHELAGPHDITPTEAGYGAFVKYHKPFFVGRRAAMERDAARTMEVVRFRVNQPGGRMVKPGSPVLDRMGKTIGVVTSCARVGEKQIGLAWVDRRSTAPRTPIAVYALPRPEKVPAGKSVLDLEVGDRVAMHEDAEILRRFYSPGEHL